MANFFEELLGTSKKKSNSVGSILGDVLGTVVKTIPGPVGSIAQDVLGGIQSRAAEKNALEVARKTIEQVSKRVVAQPGIVPLAQRTLSSVAKRTITPPTPRGTIGRDPITGKTVIKTFGEALLGPGVLPGSSRPGAGTRSPTSIKEVRPVPPPVNAPPVSSRVRQLSSSEEARLQELRGTSDRSLSFFAGGDLNVAQQQAVSRGAALSSPIVRGLAGAAAAPTSKVVFNQAKGIFEKVAVKPSAGPVQVTAAAAVPSLGRIASRSVPLNVGVLPVPAGVQRIPFSAQKQAEVAAMSNGRVSLPGGFSVGFPGGAQRFGLDPSTGQLVPIVNGGLIATSVGLMKPAGVFKFNTATQTFVKVKPRRMNPLNFKALSRASRRMEGFERIIMRSFKCESPKRLKPKGRRIVRRRRKTK